MEGLYWKSFHSGSFLLSWWCYDECPFLSSWNTVPEDLSTLKIQWTLFATHSNVDLSMCFPSNRVLPTFLYHSLDIELLALIIALATVHREKPVRASEGWTEIIQRVGNTLFWPLEGSQFVHQLCRETGRMRRKSEVSSSRNLLPLLMDGKVSLKMFYKLRLYFSCYTPASLTWGCQEGYRGHPEVMCSFKNLCRKFPAAK